MVSLVLWIRRFHGFIGTYNSWFIWFYSFHGLIGGFIGFLASKVSCFHRVCGLIFPGFIGFLFFM